MTLEIGGRCRSRCRTCGGSTSVKIVTGKRIGVLGKSITIAICIVRVVKYGRVIGRKVRLKGGHFTVFDQPRPRGVGVIVASVSIADVVAAVSVEAVAARMAVAHVRCNLRVDAARYWMCAVRPSLCPPAVTGAPVCTLRSTRTRIAPVAVIDPVSDRCVVQITVFPRCERKPRALLDG